MPVVIACLSSHRDVKALHFADVYSAHFSKAEGTDEKAAMRPGISVYYLLLLFVDLQEMLSA